MTDLKEWCEYIRAHPLKLRYDGLHSRGRSSKSDFFTSVGEAATHDESFMDDYMCEEYKSHEKRLDKAVEDKMDHDEYLSRFCAYADARVSAKDWRDCKMPNVKSWSKANITSIMQVVDNFMHDMKDEYIRDWLVGDHDEHYRRICEKENEEYLLKDHPPIAAWNNAGDFEVKLEEVFFLCPSCRDPQLEDTLGEFYTLKNGYPYFYCGSCGSEMSVGPKEHILDFFNALEITPYPFNKEKREHWQKLMSDRKAWGENKLELKVGDLVHLKVSEELPSSQGGTWTHWKDEPGETVTVTHVTNTESWSGDVKTCAGIVTEEHGFVEFHNLFARPEEARVQ